MGTIWGSLGEELLAGESSLPKTPSRVLSAAIFEIAVLKNLGAFIKLG